MKQSLHRDEATNPSRQSIALIGPISPISPIGPICPISPISLIRPISPIRPIGPICLIGPINPIAPPRLSPPPGEAGRGLGLAGTGWELWLGCAGCGLWVPTQTKKPSGISLEGLLSKKGGYLLSHGCAVPSARAGLTSLFGMGRGGTPPL